MDTRARELEGWLYLIVADRDGFLVELKLTGNGVPKTAAQRARWSWLCWTRRALELELEILSMQEEARAAERILADSPLVLVPSVLWGRACEVGMWPERIERKRQEIGQAQAKCGALVEVLAAVSSEGVACVS